MKLNIFRSPFTTSLTQLGNSLSHKCQLTHKRWNSSQEKKLLMLHNSTIQKKWMKAYKNWDKRRVKRKLLTPSTIFHFVLLTTQLRFFHFVCTYHSIVVVVATECSRGINVKYYENLIFFIEALNFLEPFKSFLAKNL